MAQFLIEKVAEKPTSKDKTAVSKAAIYLFPSLRITPSTVGGIFNSIN